ncbi:MAG: BlaI/MecI/CopY family transcriptional regulator [Candidatus Hydrogenedentes bacterium]|nr:BlaI/MecI/CopY family transcriptional regulator [Candidatus Hydrogenedentota bacterium]
MPPKTPPRPTVGELAILNVLWERGPSTVRDVQEALSAERPTGYTTALKLMQIMHEKGLLLRDDARRPHTYRVALEEEKMQRQLVGDLIQRAFGGSASKLIMQALSTKSATPEELEEINQLLKEMKE